MRLLSVDADNWLPFEGLHLDFASMSSVAIGGLNDHGKSAVLDAITMCLYGVVSRKTSTRSPDQYIRHGQDGFFLRVDFATSGGQHVSVTREKQRGVTAKLRLTVDGEDQTSAESMDATQDRIIETIGLDLTALTASAFMVQHDSAAFMVADPRDRKDLLIRMLGLDEYEPLHKAAKRVADRAAARRDQARENLDRLELTLSTATEVRARTSSAQTALDAARVEHARLQEALGESREAYQIAKAERDRLKAVADRAGALAAEREAMPETLIQLREALAEAEAAAAEAQPIVQLPPLPPDGAKDQAVTARDAALEKVRLRNDVLRAQERHQERLDEAVEQRGLLDRVPCGGIGIYATCPLLQAVPTEEQIATARLSLVNAQTSLVATEGEMDIARRWAAEIERLNEMQAFYDRASNGARLVITRWRTGTAAAVELANARRQTVRQAEARAAALALEPEIEASGEDLAAAEAALAELKTGGEQLRLDADTAKAAVGAREEQWRLAVAANARVDAAEADVAAHDADFVAATDEYEIHAALMAAWHRDGVPTQIIERALPMIEAKANDVLARLPEEMMLTLRTQRPTAKRTKGMAETLDIVVTLDGVEREYGLISWGARLRVDVALRLALGEILAHRSGQRIETIWFDEPLADLDPEGVEAMLELLSLMREEFPLIVVVSHHASFADAFEHRVEIRKVDGVSHAIVDGLEAMAGPA